MGRKETNAALVIALAYFHRYGWIVVMTICILRWQERFYEILGGFFAAHGIWSLAGYQLKWKHVYCSNQNASRQQMTPNSVRWAIRELTAASQGKAGGNGLPHQCCVTLRYDCHWQSLRF